MDIADDRCLLADAAAGSLPAMDELVRRHAPLVLAACRRQLPAAEADDAAQAVFLVLWRRAGAAAAAPGLPGWLVITARRVCQTARRAAKRRREMEHAAVSAITESPPNEARALLDQALADLPASEREAVVRRHLLGEDPAAVATALGCAEGTVHSRTSRGLERLRAWFARRGIACSTAALAGLCADECAATEAIPAPETAACTVASSAAQALAAATTTFPFAGVLLMSCAALALISIAILVSPAATVPAGETPTTVFTIVYDIRDIYQAETLLTDPDEPPIHDLRPGVHTLPPADPATVTVLDTCRNLGVLNSRIQTRIGVGCYARIVDESMSDEDLRDEIPGGIDAAQLFYMRSNLANMWEPIFPGMDLPRAVAVTSDRPGFDRLEADLQAVRRLRQDRAQAQPHLIAAVTGLRSALQNAFGGNRVFYDPGIPATPRVALPATVPTTGPNRFAVIWLPEGRHLNRPIAVATDGVNCIYACSAGILWRPGLRPAAIALWLRQSLDSHSVRVHTPLISDDWRLAAQQSIVDGSNNQKLYADLAELVRSARPEPGPPAGF